jgi:transcriptional regulator with XRE-family HTH domain
MYILFMPPMTTPQPSKSRAAQQLRLRRAQLGLTQEGVSGQSMSNEGEVLISQRTVSDLEKGNVALIDLSARRLVALARALNWSLPELQRATGIDLGLEDVGDNASVLAQQPAPQPPRPLLDELYHNHIAKNTHLFVANAGTPIITPTGAAIRKDDLLFVDIIDTIPKIGKIYMVEHSGSTRVHILSWLSGGIYWVNNNPDDAPIARADAKVIGRVVRFMSQHDA